jgi:hypothetical protein
MPANEKKTPLSFLFHKREENLQFHKRRQSPGNSQLTLRTDKTGRIIFLKLRLVKEFEFKK